jgi:hypothetical protein
VTDAKVLAAVILSGIQQANGTGSVVLAAVRVLVMELVELRSGGEARCRSSPHWRIAVVLPPSRTRPRWFPETTEMPDGRIYCTSRDASRFCIARMFDHCEYLCRRRSGLRED